MAYNRTQHTQAQRSDINTLDFCTGAASGTLLLGEHDVCYVYSLTELKVLWQTQTGVNSEAAKTIAVAHGGGRQAWVPDMAFCLGTMIKVSAYFAVRCNVGCNLLPPNSEQTVSTLFWCLGLLIGQLYAANISSES